MSTVNAGSAVVDCGMQAAAALRSLGVGEGEEDLERVEWELGDESPVRLANLLDGEVSGCAGVHER
jgi:hypothetical protein